MTLPTPENIAAIYDLERAGELALKQVFTAAQVKTFAASMLIPSVDAATDAENVAAGYDIIDYQKDRPRVEIFCTLGAGKGRFIPHPQFPQLECETTWDIGFSLFLVTRADMMVHTAFRTTMRYLIHSARGSINAVPPLANHYLHTFMDAGTSPVEKPEEGIFQTRINFTSMISVQNNAWPLLSE